MKNLYYFYITKEDDPDKIIVLSYYINDLNEGDRNDMLLVASETFFSGSHKKEDVLNSLIDKYKGEVDFFAPLLGDDEEIFSQRGVPLTNLEDMSDRLYFPRMIADMSLDWFVEFKIKNVQLMQAVDLLLSAENSIKIQFTKDYSLMRLSFDSNKAKIHISNDGDNKMEAFDSILQYFHQKEMSYEIREGMYLKSNDVSDCISIKESLALLESMDKFHKISN